MLNVFTELTVTMYTYIVIGQRTLYRLLRPTERLHMQFPVNHEAVVVDRHGLPMRTTEGSETMCCRLSRLL